MHSATIPLAALATFAGVYWLTPGPAAAPRAEPGSIVETAAPVPAVAKASLPSSAPAAKPARAPPSRPVRQRVKVAARKAVERPVRRAPEAQVYYSGCNEVRAAGLAPLLWDQPGYRPEMDGDDDGIACEPHRGRR